MFRLRDPDKPSFATREGGTTQLNIPFAFLKRSELFKPGETHPDFWIDFSGLKVAPQESVDAIGEMLLRFVQVAEVLKWANIIAFA